LVLFFGRISGLFGRSGGGKAFVRIFQINLKVGKRLSEKWGHSKNIIVPRSAALARRPAVVHPPMGDSRMRQRIIYGSLGVFELASLPGRGIRASQREYRDRPKRKKPDDLARKDARKDLNGRYREKTICCVPGLCPLPLDINLIVEI
jgi:hypothetical protein